MQQTEQIPNDMPQVGQKVLLLVTLPVSHRARSQAGKIQDVA